MDNFNWKKLALKLKSVIEKYQRVSNCADCVAQYLSTRFFVVCKTGFIFRLFKTIYNQSCIMPMQYSACLGILTQSIYWALLNNISTNNYLVRGPAWIYWALLSDISTNNYSVRGPAWAGLNPVHQTLRGDHSPQKKFWLRVQYYILVSTLYIVGLHRVSVSQIPERDRERTDRKTPQEIDRSIKKYANNFNWKTLTFLVSDELSFSLSQNRPILCSACTTPIKFSLQNTVQYAGQY